MIRLDRARARTGLVGRHRKDASSHTTGSRAEHFATRCDHKSDDVRRAVWRSMAESMPTELVQAGHVPDR